MTAQEIVSLCASLTPGETRKFLLGHQLNKFEVMHITVAVANKLGTSLVAVSCNQGVLTVQRVELC